MSLNGCNVDGIEMSSSSKTDSVSSCLKFDIKYLVFFLKSIQIQCTEDLLWTINGFLGLMFNLQLLVPRL